MVGKGLKVNGLIKTCAFAATFVQIHTETDKGHNQRLQEALDNYCSFCH